MMDRIANSWRLLKASWAVLRSDSELVIFPIVSGIASLIALALFAIPLWATGYFDEINDDGSVGVAGYIALFFLYLVLAIVVNFCNAALVGAALIRLRGGDPTVSDGFKLATARMGPIFGYSVIGATVGVILQAIRDKSGWLGDLIAGAIGVAWGLATYLVIPVLVVENVGPIEAVKRSGGLLRKTWGEQIAGNFGIGAAMGIITLGVVLVGAAVIGLAAATGAIVAIVLAVAVVVLAVVVLAVIGSALKGIYTAALYRYAAEGDISGGFSPDLVQNAFVRK